MFFILQGYISPGMEVPFTITFHPRDLSHDVRYEDLKCTLEGGKALKITLTGMCIGTPALKEVRCYLRNIVRQCVHFSLVTVIMNQNFAVCWR